MFSRLIMANSKKHPIVKQNMLTESVTIPTAETSWERHILLSDREEFWPSTHLIPHRLIRDINQRILQYKIIHRMISTKKNCIYMGLRTNKCEKCEEEEETITHLFCDCPKTCPIWKKIVDWLNSLGYRLGYYTDVQILFGDQRFDPIIKKINIATKYLIFKQKAKKTQSLTTILSKIRK